MRCGRKFLKRAATEENFTVQQGQSIVQVVSLRGSNLIEVMDAKGEKSIALFPAKFQKSMWIKRGSFVAVDESGKAEALEAGSKVACIVSQVLFHEQVRQLLKGPGWPEAFKSSTIDSATSMLVPASEQEEESGSSDDDGLPPLECNPNRIRRFGLHAGLASVFDSDTNTDEDS